MSVESSGFVVDFVYDVCRSRMRNEMRLILDSFFAYSPTSLPFVATSQRTCGSVRRDCYVH